jgi:apolipoprotein N-acyltransferase
LKEQSSAVQGPTSLPRLQLDTGPDTTSPTVPPCLLGEPPGHRMARFGLAALSGALLVLSFPHADQGWLAWLALVPLFAALQKWDPRGGPLSVRQGTRLGFTAGAVFLGGLLYWIWIFGWYAWLALTLFQALWIALFGALAAALLRRVPPSLVPPSLAAAWTSVEWLRSLGTLGLTWGDLAVSQHRMLPILQMLDWTGPWGLSFLIALVNASLAQVVLGGVQAFRRSGGEQRAEGRGQRAVSRLSFRSPLSALRSPWLAASLVVAGLLATRGSWLLAVAAPPGRQVTGGAGDRDSLPVAVVQGNIDQDVLWDDDYRRRSLERHTRLTQEAALAGARLVVWSETSLPGELRYDPTLASLVAWLARTANAELIVGSNDRTGDCEYNRAFLVDREGRIRGDYAKRHLVPYGECVPMRAWFPFLEKLHVRPFNLTPGEGFVPMRSEHAIGGIICFESAFPYISRAQARSGAELLVEITNDTWFGRTAAAAQHAAMAPLRAVETRRALARATVTGISTLVDDHGRVRRRLGLFQEGYLLEPLPLRRDLTPYVRLGDWPVYLCLVWLVFGIQVFRRSGIQGAFLNA